MTSIKKDFIKQLKTLKDRRPEVIENFTKRCYMLAENAKDITEAIFQEFNEADFERKFCLLYLMDSILKNCKEQYKDYLETGIAEAFYQTYSGCATKEDKKKLIILYHTWAPYFSGNIISGIASKIKFGLGEDISSSLTIDELNNLIDYYRKNNLDATHLVLQRNYLMDSKKVVKKDKDLKSSRPTKDQNPIYVDTPPQNLQGQTRMMAPDNQRPVQKHRLDVQQPPLQQATYKIPKKGDKFPGDDISIIKKKVKTDNMRQNPMPNQGGFQGQNYGVMPMQSNMYDQRQMHEMNQMHYQGYVQPNDPRMNSMSPNRKQMNYYPYQHPPLDDAQFSDEDGDNIPSKQGITQSHYQYDPNPSGYDMPQHMGIHSNYPPQNMPTSGRAPEKDKLREIVQLIQSSKDKKPTTTLSRPEPIIHTPIKQDIIPEGLPLTLRKTSEVNESGPVLIFKILLQNLKKELPTCLKTKYQQKIRKIESLSSIISSRSVSVIDSLYGEMPYQCSNCGLRFAHTSQLSKHIDWHFRTNIELKERAKKMSSRPALSTAESWIKEEGNTLMSSSKAEGKEEEFIFENYVPSTDTKKACKACGEFFKEIWDKEKESWMLDEAVKVKYDTVDPEEDGETDKKKKDQFDLMHFRCYKLCLENETK